MAKTAQAFINQYNDKTVDYDGAYGAQCVDAFKIKCAWIGAPVKPTKTGWAQGYWTYRMEYANYCKFITNPKELVAGDWCIWDFNSSCPQSHIGMFVSYANKEKTKANIFSQNQQKNFKGFCTVVLSLDILGALRFNKLEPEPAVSPTKSVKATGVAHSYNKKYAKTYYAQANLNCRNSGSPNAKILVTVPQNTEVTCYGYYEATAQRNWLYAQAIVNKVLYTGFFAADYLATTKASPTPVKVLKVGSKIKIKKNAMQYGKKVGFAAKVYNTVYTVTEISGNRVVFASGKTVMGAVNKADCIVQ